MVEDISGLNMYIALCKYICHIILTVSTWSIGKEFRFQFVEQIFILLFLRHTISNNAVKFLRMDRFYPDNDHGLCLAVMQTSAATKKHYTDSYHI